MKVKWPKAGQSCIFNGDSSSITTLKFLVIDHFRFDNLNWILWNSINFKSDDAVGISEF